MTRKKKKISVILCNVTLMSDAKKKATFLPVLFGLLLVAPRYCVQGPDVGRRVEEKAGSKVPVVVYLWCHSNRSSVTKAGSQPPPQQEGHKSPGEAVNISMALLPHPCYLLLLVHPIKHPQANPWQGQLLKPQLPKTSQV